MTEPLVGVVMGSASDWETMQHCAEQLRSFGVPFETRVLSAHRTPEELSAWIKDAEARGVEVFVAGAGMAAALPGVVAAQTTLPVLGVPDGVQARWRARLAPVDGADAGRDPVGVLAVGKAGAVNAAILATQILGAVSSGVSRGGAQAAGRRPRRSSRPPTPPPRRWRT